MSECAHYGGLLSTYEHFVVKAGPHRLAGLMCDGCRKMWWSLQNSIFDPVRTSECPRQKTLISGK